MSLNKTKIAWTDFTWNPAVGCSPISEGCERCYAKKVAKRFNGRIDGDASNPETRTNPEPFKVTIHPERLFDPLRRRKPSKIFVCSMGDLFHESITDEFIYEVFKVMNDCQQHIFQLLTKRPERMKEFIENIQVRSNNFFWRWPLPNIWLGVTAENQKRADERIPLLLQTPAAKRFVSYEPALGPVIFPECYGGCKSDKPDICNGCYHLRPMRKIDWIIAGGETGPGARECREEWIKSVYDQCKAKGVPFFFKQPGKKWIPTCVGLACTFCDACNLTLGTKNWEARREFPKV